MIEVLEACADLPLLTVPAGEVLLAEGEPPGRMLVLESGAVVVERAGVPFARIDTPGAVLGEMSVVLRRSVTATVRASTDVRLRVVEEPERFLLEQPALTLAVLRMTAARLDGLTQYLVDVKRQFADEAGHLGMLDQILDTLVHHQGPVSRPGSARDPEGTVSGG